jgi:hypothetical protein
VVLAGKLDGDVKVLLDWRAALAFGAVAGILAAILRRR